MYGEEVQPSEFNVTVPYIDIDREIHSYIIKKYIKLVLPEIIGTLLLALGSGGLALLFTGTMRIIMAVIAVLFLIGFFWNLSGLFEILAKKYRCAIVEVKKVWDDNGTLKCRIAPDVYRKLDYTDEIELKRHTRNDKYVKENSQVIVVEAKKIMYLYLFDYDGVKIVTENKNVTIKTNTQYMPSKVYRDEFMSQRIVEHPYFGTLAFDIGEDEDGGVEYTLDGGLGNVDFGPTIMGDYVNMSVGEDRLEESLYYLEKISKNMNEILNGLYSTILKKCSEKNVAFPDNVRVDEEYIGEGYHIEEMDVHAHDILMHGDDEIVIKMYGIWEDHEGNTPFGGGCIETVIRCKSDTVEYHIS